MVLHWKSNNPVPTAESCPVPPLTMWFTVHQVAEALGLTARGARTYVAAWWANGGDRVPVVRRVPTDGPRERYEVDSVSLERWIDARRRARLLAA